MKGEIWNEDIANAGYFDANREMASILRPDLFEPLRSEIKRKEFKEILEPL